MRKDELVSICVLCYNHEKFIEKTLRSIIKQETSFEVRIYVNDDHSLDNSVQIIEELQKIFPDKITLLKNDKNRGQYDSAMNLLREAKGEYIALMDGDDYWTYEHKLQYQIDFLEKNTDYIACCHDAVIEKHDLANGKIAQLQSKGFYKYISQFTRYTSNEIQAYELLRGESYIQNTTLIWHKFDLSPYTGAFRNARYNLDWYFGVILASNGKIHYINETWAVYSDHAGGRTKNNYFHSYLPDKVKLLKSLFKIDFYNKLYFRHIIYELISQEYYGLIVLKSDEEKNRKYLLFNAANYSKYNLLKIGSFLYYVSAFEKTQSFLKLYNDIRHFFATLVNNAIFSTFLFLGINLKEEKTSAWGYIKKRLFKN